MLCNLGQTIVPNASVILGGAGASQPMSITPTRVHGVAGNWIVDAAVAMSVLRRSAVLLAVLEIGFHVAMEIGLVGGPL